MAVKILSVFPEINRTWLLTGEGPMLNTDSSVPTAVRTPAGEVDATLVLLLPAMDIHRRGARVAPLSCQIPVHNLHELLHITVDGIHISLALYFLLPLLLLRRLVCPHLLAVAVYGLRLGLNAQSVIPSGWNEQNQIRCPFYHALRFQPCT